jgi:hypothetical protein
MLSRKSLCDFDVSSLYKELKNLGITIYCARLMVATDHGRSNPGFSSPTLYAENTKKD